jgi:hypothetical protein
VLKRLYVLFALAVIGGYAYAGYRGLELSWTEKGVAPASARGAHTGSGAFWYGGYRGGK